ncbi:MAG TPA: RNA polymerase sigma factor [Thermoanaerobaculia bacterium]|jgi:RNA polymerase sigma-70 factor (ECF subfamily)
MTGERDEDFRVLYKDHFNRVVGYLTRLGVPRDEAPEIAQDAFMRVYESMGRIRESPAVYLYTAARNLARNKYRDDHALKRDGVSVSLDGVEPASETPSAETVLVHREKRARFRAAIAELPVGMRQALLLRLEEHSYKEIGTILGINMEAVKSRIHDARVRLQQRLGEEPPSGDDPGSQRDG